MLIRRLLSGRRQRELLDRVALQRVVGPLTTLLALDQTRLSSFFIWCETVGCDSPSGSIRSQTQTGSSLVASRFTPHTRRVAERLEQLRRRLCLRVAQRRRRERRAARDRLDAAIDRYGLSDSAHIDTDEYIEERRSMSSGAGARLVRSAQHIPQRLAADPERPGSRPSSHAAPVRRGTPTSGPSMCPVANQVLNRTAAADARGASALPGRSGGGLDAELAE